MLWQAFLRIFNFDLHISGVTFAGLELGSASSGQVTGPFIKDSNRWRVKEKQSGEEWGIFCSRSALGF